jgi:hypothetical protein
VVKLGANPALPLPDILEGLLWLPKKQPVEEFIFLNRRQRS